MQAVRRVRRQRAFQGVAVVLCRLINVFYAYFTSFKQLIIIIMYFAIIGGAVAVDYYQHSLDYLEPCALLYSAVLLRFHLMHLN